MDPDRPIRPAGLSVRWKLTLSYAGFLVVSGAALGMLGLLVLRYLPDGNLVMVPGGGFVPDRGDLLRVAVPLFVLGLVLLAAVGTAGGWVLAGRMLRPLTPIGEGVRLAGQGSLSHRIALAGPDDEFARLADAFDRMLERLQQAFEEQQRFTANASHQLRTPHAVMKTMLQVAAADPVGRDVDQLVHRLAEVNDRSIATLESLLDLSRADRAGQDARRDRFDLAEVVEDALELAAGATDSGHVRVEVSLPQVEVLGDRDLVVQLAGNLLHNAIVHNLPADGVVEVAVSVDDADRAVLTVSNTGERLTREEVATLTEPFVRAGGRSRTRAGPEGSGLGLAVVAAIARAHQAGLSLRPRPDGGLVVVVRFPSFRR